MPNPLIPDILALLRAHPEGISEHRLLKALADHRAFSRIGDSGQLALFQKHFLIMNGLYRLRRRLWEEERLVLKISPLRIQVIPPDRSAPSTHPAQAEGESLSAYYLDWKNFENTTEEDVFMLLNEFWRRYRNNGAFPNAEARSEALRVLDLRQQATNSDIRRRYRELAARHHPDKGGSGETFVRIRQAYEILMPDWRKNRGYGKK